MGAYYDEIEIEDMVWDTEKNVYHYPCPCGDRFEISRQQLRDCEDVATCPSCSLIIRVIYDPVGVIADPSMQNNLCTLLQLDFEDDPSDEEEEEEEEDDSESDDHFEDALEKLSIADDA